MSGLLVRPPLRTAVSVGCVLVTAAALLVPAGSAVAAAAGTALAAQSARPVAGAGLVAKAGHVDTATPAAARRTTVLAPPTWPAATTVAVDLSGARTTAAPAAAGTAGSATAGADLTAGARPVRVANSPVSITPLAAAAGTAAAEALAARTPTMTRASVQVFDHATATALGVSGLVLRVARTDGVAGTGAAKVSVDYAAFRNAYGADWVARLQLVQLPACALSTPAAPGCATPTPLASDNDRTTGTVSATASVLSASAVGGGTVLALTAGAKSGAGDYSVTTLTPSSVWSAGGSAGDFEWSYALRMPPALNGPGPDVTLSYSAQSVDGMMAASNNQPSWIGQGFEWWPGYIERRYKPCAEDMDGTGHNNATKTGDECWVTDNATLSLNGHSGELIKDASDPNRWHLRHDDGTLITHMTGAPNGARNGEYWVVTTANGTQFWFGGQGASNATWTVPVYGNDPKEPCNAPAFADSGCTQAWRWNLDYVVDPHANTMTYTYAKETNKYGRNGSTTDLATYDRGGRLTEIDYGTRTDTTGSAPMQVLFGADDRCLSGCTVHDAAHWPDTPWDQECTTSPCTNGSPTFWGTKRLTSVTTRVWNAAATPPGYADVEKWTFTQSFPDPGDGTRAGLWLSKISHSGLVGTTTTLPDITFDGTQLANRVDTANDSLYPMNWWRVAVVHTETGGQIAVTYSPQDCTPGVRMPDKNHLESNILRCYPVIWTPPGATNPITDFFNKYVVTEVKQDDLTGGGPTIYTDYDYLGDPAWHYTDDDGLIKSNTKTWSVWRGYGTVRTRTGDPTKMTQLSTETTYFRGMNGDHLPSGQRSVTLPAVNMGSAPAVPAVPDEDAYSGQTRQTITFNSVNGTELSATVDEPWESAPTASRTINGTTVNARLAAVGATHTRVPLDTDGGTRAAGFRTTSSYTTFDSQGASAQIDDHGDDAVTGDEKCTQTTYARNTAAWLMAYASRTQVFATDCATVARGGLTEADVISDGRTLYDHQAYGVVPTKGEITEVDALQSYDPVNPGYIMVSKASFDAYGRKTDSWDTANNHSMISYQPMTGGPVVGMVATNPFGWTSTTTYQPAWETATSVVDPNGHRTDVDYDGLGRLLRVWQPGQSKAGGASPTFSYAYLVRANGATAVTTNKLTPAGTYVTSVSLMDGLLRQRQTQSPGAGTAGGRIINDTYYDSAGRAYESTSPYMTTGAPATDFFTPTVPEDLPSVTVSTFDGLGRPVSQDVFLKNAFRWRTTTAYTGDRTDVTPPAGGTATSTLVDATGHAVALRQYHGATPSGAYDLTTYAYDRRGNLSRVTDPSGMHWDDTYNLQGQLTKVVDPDKGTTTMAYDPSGHLATSRDNRNITVAYTYDALGRKTSERQDSVTGTKLAEWTYDTLLLGLPTKSIRYDATGTYTSEVLGYNIRSQPTSTKVTIPTTDTSFGATSFMYVYTYNADGTAATSRIPAVGGLATETLTYGYNALGLPNTVSTNLGGTLVTATGYTDYAEPSVLTLRNNSGKIAQLGEYYEDGTHRLLELKATSASAPTTTFADVNYSYSDAGDVARIADTTSSDTQCLTYDYLRRLTAAWTPSSGNCGTAPTVAGLGGPAPYWQSWTFDAAGDRKTQVDHAATDTTRTYNYPPAGTAPAHGVKTVDTTGGATGTTNYTYDEDGNTRARPGGAAGQTLTWDPDGRLSSAVDSTGTTSYVYDADGNRLLRKDPTGETLYLPGQEVRYNSATGAATSTRYYTHGSSTVAMRTPSGLTWLFGDPQNTTHLAVTATTQAVSVRRTNPYGVVRGTSGTWPAAMDKGLVGGTVDNTGLTHLGSREYDPTLGRFVSVDPVFDIKDPQSFNAYGYSDNSPVTRSDPSGQDSSACTGMCATYSQYYTNQAQLANAPVVVFVSPHFGFDKGMPNLDKLGDAFTKATTKDYRWGAWGLGEWNEGLPQDISEYGYEVALWDSVCQNNSGLCPKGFADEISGLHQAMNKAYDDEVNKWRWPWSPDPNWGAITGAVTVYFRTMVKDDDGYPKEGSGRRLLGVREADYELNEDGTINVDADMPPGLSTAPNDPNKLPPLNRPQWLVGGQSKDTLFGLDDTGDLQARADPNRAGHVMLGPTATANEIEDYGIAVAATRSSWIAIESQEDLIAYEELMGLEMLE